MYIYIYSADFVTDLVSISFFLMELKDSEVEAYDYMNSSFSSFHNVLCVFDRGIYTPTDSVTMSGLLSYKMLRSKVKKARKLSTLLR